VTHNSTPGGWDVFRRDLARRWCEPFQHATYCFYFFASVIVIGGLGIWVELVLLAEGISGDAGNLRTAIATFFPALIGSTCLQILFGAYLRQLRAFAVAFTLVFAAIGLWLIADRNLSTPKSLIAGGLSSFASLWFWWIANAFNADYFDEQDPTAPIGGEDPNAKLGGTLEGFDS
jgi:hypothetical protein